MNITYGDIVETVRDERGTVVGFDETGYIIVRLDDQSMLWVNPRHVDLVEHAVD